MLSGTGGSTALAEDSTATATLAPADSILAEVIVLDRVMVIGDPDRSGTHLTARENKVSVWIPGLGVNYKLPSGASVFAGVRPGLPRRLIGGVKTDFQRSVPEIDSGIETLVFFSLFGILKIPSFVVTLQMR